MKKAILAMSVLCLATVIGACGDKEKTSTKYNKGNPMEKTLKEQVAKEEGKTSMETLIDEQVDKLEREERDGQEGNFAAQFEQSEFDAMIQEAKNHKSSGDIDYDLTEMNSDMIYATVFLMVTDPDSFIDKTIRMKGQYYAALYEPNGKTYNYCFIRDAAGCCSQGLEFDVDSKFKYPDDFPEDGADIMVTGTFEKYYEDGKIYCRIKDAKMWDEKKKQQKE